MKRISLLMSLALTFVGTAIADADRSNIRARGKAFIAAWNHHDTAAMAALWAPDGDVINPMGHWGRGRAEIESLFEKEHSTMMKDSRLSLKEEQIRFIEEDVAVVDWEIVLRGMTLPNGDVHPPLTHHVTTVVEKDNGQWWFSSCRPYVFMTGEKTASCEKASKCSKCTKDKLCARCAKARGCTSKGCTKESPCGKCAGAKAKTCPEGKTCTKAAACKDGALCKSGKCSRCKS